MAEGLRRGREAEQKLDTAQQVIKDLQAEKVLDLNTQTLLYRQLNHYEVSAESSQRLYEGEQKISKKLQAQVDGQLWKALLIGLAGFGLGCLIP